MRHSPASSCPDHISKSNTRALQQLCTVASISSCTRLCHVVQCDVLSVECTSEALFRDDVTLNRVRKARKPSESCASRLADKHISISALLQLKKRQSKAVHMSSSQRKLFEPYDTSLALRCIQICSGMLSVLSSRFMPRKAVFYTSSALDMSFLISKKSEIIRRAFVVLRG